MQTPAGTSNFQSFTGTPVMMLRWLSFHPLPMKLFSTHSSEFLGFSSILISAFWVNMAGCGFTLCRVISRWSITRFCTARVDEIISRLVP